MNCLYHQSFGDFCFILFCFKTGMYYNYNLKKIVFKRKTARKKGIGGRKTSGFPYISN